MCNNRRMVKVLSFIPNLFTLLRGVFVFIGLYFFLVCRPVEGIIWFLLAGFSDCIDGWVARKCGWESEFGRLMDPIMDKILVLTGFCLLAMRGLLPWWIVGVISVREIGITGLRLYWIRKGKGVVPAIFSGKLKTTLQMITVFFGLFVITFNWYWATKFVFVLGICSLILSVYSGYEIIMRNQEGNI